MNHTENLECNSCGKKWGVKDGIYDFREFATARAISPPSTARCGCGRHALRLGPVVGRASQKLKLKGTTIFPAALKSVLDSFPEIAGYVVLARRSADGADAVEVRFAWRENCPGLAGILRERFQGTLKVVPELTPAAPSDIEALQMPAGARKRRYFLDLRQPAAPSS